MSLREAHKGRIRASLVEAAFAELGERGIEGLTADLVAERAGVSRRTLFNYFGSVEEILLSPSVARMDTLLGQMQEADPGTPLLVVLRDALPAVFDAEGFTRIAQVWRAAEASPSLHRSEAAVVDHCVQAALESAEDTLRERGEQPDRLFLAGLARSALGAIETAAEAWRAQTSGRVDEQSRQLFLDLARRALDHLMAGYGSGVSTSQSHDTTPDTHAGAPADGTTEGRA